MNAFLIALGFFGLFILLMAVGVIFKGKRITGSCGGLNAMATNEDGEKVCGICGIPAEQMKKKNC